MDFEETKKTVLKYSKDPRIQWGITILLFLTILIIGANIRLQPIVNGNLIDETTGDYTPLALDPYYFLRHSEVLVENNGVYPESGDNMRYSPLDVEWSTELTPYATVFIWEVIKIFNTEATLNFANVLSPVIFYILGIISFFILLLILTKNKIVSVSGVAILSVIPPYLYRTLAGFSDHEAIGMFGFFLSLLMFAVGMVYLNNKKRSPTYTGSILIGILSGVATSFAVSGWGGGAAFLFMIMPLAFIITWMMNKKNSTKSIFFYSSWIVGAIVGAISFGTGGAYLIKRYMLNTTGIFTFLTLGYMIINYLGDKYLPKKAKNYNEIISILTVIFLGGVLYQIFVGNFFLMIGNLVLTILYPFGTGRVGVTVAENAQPYLTDLIAQIGKSVFIMLLLGCFVVGIQLFKNIKEKKKKLLLISSFSLFIFGILFSRISETSILNGENFISKFIFAGSFLFFAGSSVYVYSKTKWDVDARWIFIAAWMFPMLLASRSAIRVFFLIVPFISLIIPLALLEIWKFGNRNKDEIVKVISYALVIGLAILLLISMNNYYQNVNAQAKAQTPSYTSTWQNAMAWVRNNTEEGSIFLHWWDYGYWVETGGNRPAVTDGGHFNGYWDHLIGRYVLTTPYPETAKSFMKAHNVSYLLIDPSDIGKYAAYSSIGDDEEVNDRTSYLTPLTSDPSAVKETSTGIIRYYQGGFYLDSDLVYEQNGREILLPSGKAGLGAVIIEKQIVESGNQTGYVYNQPEGIYVYNGQQYQLPIRYLYVSGQLIDFESGINATAYVYANVYNQQFDQEGAVMYLSEKVKDSLIAKLYLMDDPDNEYPELELVHSEGIYGFGFNYGGYQGQLKIYKVNLDEMDNIIAREEFTYIDGEYGGLDDLEFTI